MGVAVADFNNDGFPDVLITAVGQNRLFQNTGKAWTGKQELLHAGSVPRVHLLVIP